MSVSTDRFEEELQRLLKGDMSIIVHPPTIQVSSCNRQDLEKKILKPQSIVASKNDGD
jgi:hypothetical protein